MGKMKALAIELEELEELGLETAYDDSQQGYKEFESSYPSVNHPPHYTQGGIECITAIKAALTPEEFRGYCKGNAMKYIWREQHKGGMESLMKATWYLKELENASDTF